MKIRFFNLVLCLALILFTSCNDDYDNTISELNIRVSNTSLFDFQDLKFNASTENATVAIDLANLNSQQMTEYMQFETAESIPNVELKIEGETFSLVPYTTGHEVPLENGNYTYEIHANESQDTYSKLSFSLVKD